MDDVSLLIVERGKQLSLFSFWRVLAHRAEWKGGAQVTIRDIAHPYKLLTSQYIRYVDASDLSNIPAGRCLWLARAYLCEHWLRPPRMPRSTNSNMSTSVRSSNRTPVYLSIASHVKLGSVK